MAQLQAQFGLNALPEGDSVSFYSRFLRQFKSPVIYILLVALVLDGYFWWSEGAHALPLEAITILLILLLNAFLGVWQESKSEAALARLKALSSPQTWVKRDGCLQQIASADLVPQDLIRVEAGERIPADGEVVTEASLLVDESVVTGESLPVEKVVGDRVLSGTLAQRGSAWVQVTATGVNSNMGQLAHLLQNVQSEQTPLEKRLQHFGRQIALVIVVLAVAMLGLGAWTQGISDISRLLLFSIALAVAAVPESLPAVLTLAMALGMERMAKRNAVVRRLTAVEALGSVTVIATDKTGTLTENKMRVERLEAEDQERALHAMVLANDADEVDRVGDPLELGLLDHAAAAGLNLNAVRKQCPRQDQRPFD